ncbi:MAG: insulinase family protein [Prochloraceae cyanobacterium]|nr:insulinase family protein [Prochloraceae cyanobacterium]
MNLETVDASNSHKTSMPNPNYEVITLENGLDVMLISHPRYIKSGGAMAVKVGNTSNPKEHLGLAHFLEHMLFISSQNFPGINFFDSYLNAHGGASNAYTDTELTNYYFCVDHDYFEGALVRFADLIANPLLDSSYLERELKAIDSEFAHSKEIDSRRILSIKKAQSNPQHPANQFGCGNWQTLAHTGRDDLMGFYQQHYSSECMKMVLVSNKPITELKNLAAKYFSILEKRKTQLPDLSAPLRNNDLPKIIRYKSLKKERKLTLSFVLPEYASLSASKPERLIKFLLEHEGRHSLAKYLKDKGLIRELWTWSYTESFASEFEIELVLTKLGEQRSDEIIRDINAYIRVLSSIPLPKHITAADLSVFSKQLIDKGFVKGIVYGNLEKKGATELVSQVLTQLNYEPEYPHYADSRSHIALREGTNIYLHQNLTKNNAMVEVTEIGYPTISKIAKARLLEIVLDKSFYQELRTNRQLGYFVKSFAIEKEDYLGQAYVIDSEKTSPNDAYLAVQEWKQKATQMIETMSDASFFDYKQSLIVELRAPPQSMSDYCSYFYYLAIEKKGNFHWTNELAASVKQLSKDEFAQFACQILDKSQSNSLAVFSFASQQPPVAVPGVEVIRDGLAFKQLGAVIEPESNGPIPSGRGALPLT